MVHPGSLQIGSLLSPVIVGRDDTVALGSRRLDEVVAGHGQMVLVSGEAGIGKTRVLAAIGRLAAERGLRVAKGDLAPQDRDVMAASFLDLGRAMRRDAAFGTIGGDLLRIAESRLTAAVARRRDMVMEIVDLISASDPPTMLAFDDLQWADDLSLETLTEVARQTRDRPLLLVGAYRTNEAMASSVLREWRSRLVTQRIAEEVRLGRLSRDDTALLTTLILGTGLPAPRDVVDAVYARTDGVPLHVEELCSALGRERLADSRAVLDAAVPETLGDATLARVAQLSPEAQSVARAGAVVGRSFVPSVLAGIMNLPVDSLDDPIQELVDHDVLDAVRDGGQYDFRHQLLRDALYRSVAAGDRRRFHARAAEFGALLEGASAIHASVHYERAGMTAEAFRTALAAARQAMKMSSHREAFELFRRALDNMPAELPDDEKVPLLLIYSDAAANIDRNVLSGDLAARARELALRTGHRFGAIEALSNIASMARREGEGLAKRRDLGRRLLNEIEAAPAGAERDAFHELGLYNLAVVEYDACRPGEARALFAEARDVALGTGDAVGVDTQDQYLAQLDVIDGRVAEGLARLRAIGEATRADGQEDNGVSCYRDVALLAMRAMDFREANVGLAEGLLYAESVEQTYCGHILASSEAIVSWANGHWDEAARQGGHALSDPGSGYSHAMAQWALGYVDAGRGLRPEAEKHLLPALDFGRRSERPDMLLPALWGLAEAALHDHHPEQAAALCDEALQVARERGERALLGPFAVVGVRAHQANGEPERAARYLDQLERAVAPLAHVVEPALRHARGLVQLAEGAIILARESFVAAIEGWDSRGRTWEESWARLDLASALLRSRRFADALVLIDVVGRQAEALGSRPLVDRADQLKRQARGHSTAVEPWHPLTSREFEVARAIAEGKTNPELADELGISPKTASSHVEHILAKLGATRRAEVAAWATSVMAASGAARDAAAIR